MGDDQKKPEGAGAPEEVPATPTLSSTAGIKVESAAQAKGITNIEEALRTVRDRTATSPKEKLLNEAVEKTETAEMRRALGLDVPFDVRKLLTTGIVERRGMQVGTDMFIDMHTLNKAEDIMADRLVEQTVGPMELTKSYLETKVVAVLAMAITRVNSQLFPVPSMDPADRGTDEWKAAWDIKRTFMMTLLQMQGDDIDALSMVYTRLDQMDILVEEEARKKSG